MSYFSDLTNGVPAKTYEDLQKAFSELPLEHKKALLESPNSPLIYKWNNPAEGPVDDHYLDRLFDGVMNSETKNPDEWRAQSKMAHAVYTGEDGNIHFLTPLPDGRISRPDNLPYPEMCQTTEYYGLVGEPINPRGLIGAAISIPYIVGVGTISGIRNIPTALQKGVENMAGDGCPTNDYGYVIGKNGIDRIHSLREEQEKTTEQTGHGLPSNAGATPSANGAARSSS